MNVIEMLDRGALLDPDAVAFTDADHSETLTYRDTVEITHRVAAALHRDEIGPGSPVGVLSPNSVRGFPYVLGGLRAGCPWIGINARSNTTELIGFLTRIGAVALFVHPSLQLVAEEIQAAVPTLRAVIAMEGPEAEAWLAPAGSRVDLPTLDPESVVALFSTGGTTGEAKAVEVPQRALLTMTLAMTTHLAEQDPPVNLVAAPLTHAAGALIFPVLVSGGTNVIHPAVDPGAILKSIARSRVTRMFLPPTAVYGLLDHPGTRAADFSSLHYFIYGAAPMSVAKLREAIDVFGPVMAQFYGQVELPMMCTFLSPREHVEAIADPAKAGRLASCGRPSVVANVAVMDDEGNLLPPGSEGEIVVRSSLQMLGYLGDSDASREITRPGGWQATGDLGKIDDAGYVYLLDRKRDLIISGGFNVFPAEVEQVLWQHSAVLDCAVIGLPDPKWGEQVTAVVEVKPGLDVTAEELIDWCRSRLGPVKSPKAVILAPLPRSTVGKVLKRVLREQYWSGQGRRV